jgi:tRNA pseudouridine38-40 synthase
MPRFKILVAYDGTDFHGWQRQTPPDLPPGEQLRTVQGVLEEAVRAVVREPVSVLGASRTDAGVHARGQVAVFATSRQIPLERLPAAITSRLPEDVQVWRAETVSDAFDPIADARAKGYRYRLSHDCRRAGRPPLFDRRYTAWTAYRLDPARMHEAAAYLVGQHDFASFARQHHGRESTVRTIFRCRVRADSPRRCIIDVAGSGFLYNMVRIIAGTLLEVGRGRIDPACLPEIIAARDRRAAGSTMPPEGLCLRWIRYGRDEGAKGVRGE